MSFTSTVKNEINGMENSKIENASELSAVLSVLAQRKEDISLVTENVAVAKRVFSLLKELFKVNCQITIRQGYNFNKKFTYILKFSHDIENELGLDLKEKQQIPAAFIVEDEELKKAFLRGVFLATGYINDPKKTGYHLEFTFINDEFSNYVKDLLNYFSLNAKRINREKKVVVYLKEAEKISDFLKLIGVGGGLFYYEDVRIYRDHKNMINRLNNCEQANVEKMMDSASKQVALIDIIKQEKLEAVLDDKLKVVADYRLKYPESSYKELAEIISMETGEKLTKSGVYHRMKKIEDFVKKIVS